VEVEAEAFRAGAPGQWEVSLAAEITRLEKRGSTTVPAPSDGELLSVASRAQQFNFSAKQLCSAGKTMLAATMESKAAPARGEGEADRPRQVMMLFVKVLE
jgi:hypothetical protein